MHAPRLTAVAAYIAIAAVLGCSESASLTAPKPMAVTSALSKPKIKPNGDNGGKHGERVRVLRWHTPLHQAVYGSAYIGPDGGSVTIPTLGVTFTVPAGALSTRTLITVVAPAGHYVAFQMSPAGTQFNPNAQITLDLSKTNVYRNKSYLRTLVGGYIPAISAIGSDDTANDTEDYPAITNDGVTSATWPVPHFSVVILASQLKCPKCGTVVAPPAAN